MEISKILVVDDEESMANAIAELLKKDKREVRVAYSLKKAKEIINNEGADIIISDVYFPDEEDGFSLAKWVLEINPEQEIIFISGYGNTEMEKKSRIQGAVRFFHKPIDFNILEKLVENIENKLKEGQAYGLKLPKINGTIKDSEAKQLQEAYLSGEDEALDKLLSGYKNLVFFIGKNWYNLQKEDLEDLYQDLCIEVMLKISRIKNLRTFIIGTTMNMARKIIFKNSRYIPAEENNNYNVSESSIENKIIKKELEKNILKAIEKLAPKMKELVFALFFEDLSYKEISDKYRIPIGSIGPTRLKILKELKQNL